MLVATLVASFSLAAPPPPPPIRIAPPRVTFARILEPLPRGYYPIHNGKIENALKSCGFHEVTFGMFPTYTPISVDPDRFDPEKLDCFKRWAVKQTDLQIEWLK